MCCITDPEKRLRNPTSRMSLEIEQLAKSLDEIQQRNKRVEQDKAWETSNVRRVIIAVLTYFVMTLFMWSMGTAKPCINSLIPTVGFVLSTLSLPIFKRWWLKAKG